MEKIRLGKTDLQVTRTAFGALPVQRRSFDDAVAILRRAYDAGINYFDTARAYSDSEEKLGRAFPPALRQNLVISTKTQATAAPGFWDNLHTSLKNLNTDYIDIYQFHNPDFVPQPGGADGLYDAMLKAKEQGKIRHISLTNHRLEVAEKAVRSGLYDTLQFPFSLLASERDIKLAELCKTEDMGFIAMKALSGGLITKVAPTFTFIRQYPQVVPIWGIQHMHELEEFIALANDPPAMDEAMQKAIAADKSALSGDFCRGCGYCAPCPAEIEIHTAARIYFLATRSPYQQFITPEFQAKMARIDDCTGCEACKTRCPYELDTPELLKRQYALYKTFVQEHS
jgi:aryl-alcohol dehydrogenase-like predicted oxidoreductase